MGVEGKEIKSDWESTQQSFTETLSFKRQDTGWMKQKEQYNQKLECVEVVY